MNKLLSFAVATLFACGASNAATCEYKVEPVSYKNLVAQLYLPKTAHKVPAVIAFGGSEGGISTGTSSGEMLAPHCIAVLGLAYFKDTGLPPRLEQIPLEYFVDAIDYVAHAPGVDAGRIGVVSGSRGSEAALLVASMDARIKSVVVATPSNVARPAAWTWQGRELASLAIPVERINGAVFLISAENDQVWPSTRMSNEMVSQLKASGFTHPVKHDSYPTGHGFSKELAPRIRQSVVDRFVETLAP